MWPALGHHFERAGLAEPAAQYLRLAASHARTTYANAQAIALHRRAIPLVLGLGAAGDPSWQRTLLEHQESLGDILALTSQRVAARVAYDAALGGVPNDDAVTQARLYRKLGKTWEAEHQHKQALAWYAKGRLVVEPHDFDTHDGARDEWIQLHVEELWVHYWLNQVPDMEATVERVTPAMEIGASTLQRSKFFHAQAMKNLRRDRYTVSAETLQLVEQTLAVCLGGGLPLELPMVQFFYGFCLLLHDSLDEAETELHKALALARRAGEIGQQARCLTYVTLLARRREQLDEAERHAEDSLELSARSELREYVAAAWANQAWVALRRGDRAAATSAAERALDTWRQVSAVFPFHWLALLPLLEIELGGGRMPRAMECVEALLAPAQHALPETGLIPLGDALRYWHDGDEPAARRHLDLAINGLKDCGYS